MFLWGINRILRKIVGKIFGFFDFVYRGGEFMGVEVRFCVNRGES